MRALILGGTGELGQLLSNELSARGHSVDLGSRRTGVDAYTGNGLPAAMARADVVFDCLNIATINRGKALDFFTTCARKVTAAAKDSQIQHLVVLSIVKCDDPAFEKFGYYAGKTAQIHTYRAAAKASSGSQAPYLTTIARTTQWFTLAQTMLGQARLGPIAIVPPMQSQPIAPEAAAKFLANQLSDSAAPGHNFTDVSLAGPQRENMAELAKAFARRRGLPRWILSPKLPLLPAGIYDGSLLPGPEVPLDQTTFEQWFKGNN